MGKEKEAEWKQVISTGLEEDHEGLREGVEPQPRPTLEEMQGEEWQAPPPVDGWQEVVGSTAIESDH